MSAVAGKKGKYELEIMIAGTTDKSLEAAIKKARGELSRLERSAGLSSKAVSDSFGGMSIRGIDNLAAISDKAFAGIKIAAGATAAGITAVLGASIAAGSGFEAQMSTVRAISGASEKDMERLTDIAEEMGRTTKFSATESGKGLEYMAMAGWKTEDMLNGLPGIMNLAAASGEELGRVSDIVTDAMTAFGMQANESARFADVLAQASASSNTNVAMMGETFQYVAPIAGSFGYTIEDVALATGLMANSGIKGEKAGTALRGMLTNLAKPTKQMRGYMEELGISLTDSAGEIMPFRDLLGDLRTGFSDLTEAQKAEYAAGIAGKEAMSGLLAVVNSSDTDFDKLAGAIDHSTGAAERMSEVQLDNLRGDLTLVKSAAEGAGIEIYNGLAEPLRDAAQWTEGWLNSFTENFTEYFPTIRREVLKFGTDLKKGFAPLMDIGEWFLEHPEVVKGGIMGIGTALLTFKAAKVAKDGILLLSKLSAAVTAWPVAAAGLVMGGIVGIGAAIQESERRAAEQNLAEHFGDITLSMEELNEAARNTLGDGLFNSLDMFGEASDKSSEFYQSMQKGLRDINKASWKLSVGIEFAEGDTQAYVAAVNQYVSNAQEYVTNSGYELKLAASIVFGEGADTSGSDNFYLSMNQTLEALRANLQENLDDIAENGLTLPKERIVNSYLQDISEITQMITDAQAKARFDTVGMKFSGTDMMSGDTFLNFQQEIGIQTNEAISGIDKSTQEILASLNYRRDAFEKGIITKEEGGLDQAGFEAEFVATQAGQYQQKAEVAMYGLQVMKDTILQQYGSEIQPALEAVEKSIQESLIELATSGNATPEALQAAIDQSITDALNAGNLSESSRGAIEKLVVGMKPTMDQIGILSEQYKTAGGDLANASYLGLQEGINDTEKLAALSGSRDAMVAVLGGEIGDDQILSTLLAAARENGAILPDGVIQAIEEGQPEAITAAENMLNEVREKFSAGTEPVTIPIPVNYKMTAAYLGTGSVESGLGGGKTPAHYATGGLIEHPTLSYFAENSPEMAIPIDGSNRSMELWQEAGRLLGAYEQNNYSRVYQTMSQSGVTAAGSSGSTFAPVFSPQIHYQGTASREDVEQSVQATYEQFVAWAERLAGERARAAF